MPRSLKTGYSSTEPSPLEPCNGGVQYRHNITNIPATEDTPEQWSFEYVSVPLSFKPISEMSMGEKFELYANIVSSMVAAKYPMSEEIGLARKHTMGLDTDGDFIAYSEEVERWKTSVKQVLGLP